jgi:hypothetical protein
MVLASGSAKKALLNFCIDDLFFIEGSVGVYREAQKGRTRAIRNDAGIVDFRGKNPQFFIYF